jgi:hypothetical protein
MWQPPSLEKILRLHSDNIANNLEKRGFDVAELREARDRLVRETIEEVGAEWPS